jgi:sugar fermentation stimulation protein A
MQFPQPLESGVLVQRYKRFFADVVMDDGRHITAHCPNTGPMLGLSTPGARVWLSHSDSPTRKLAYTWELVQQGNALVGSNTMLPNKLVGEALANGVIDELADYDLIRREVRYGENSRVDFLLEAEGRAPCFVEVKNVNVVRTSGLAEFPDCVSTRALKHLDDLAREAATGARAVLLFVIQRDDCSAFAAAADLDPAYAARLIEVAGAGVEILCYHCDISTNAVTLARPIRWAHEI